jgi:hypothetical protein
VTLSQQVTNGSRRLRQRADALGAQHLLHFLTVLNDRHLLEIGMERTIGCPFGERDVVTESSGLTTMSAFCHFLDFLSIQIMPAWFGQAAYSTTNRTLVQVGCYSF